MPFQVTSLDIKDVLYIETQVFHDPRGSFHEVFKTSVLKSHGVHENFVQGNYSRSQKNIVRGLHYQLAPHAQGKLVTVIQGEIYDVAVDIRTGSPTYGEWVGRVLTAERRDALYIPPGFAHGYCSLTDQTDILYLNTAEYEPGAERGILWNDPALAISWPVTKPLLSDKDKLWPVLAAAEKGR